MDNIIREIELIAERVLDRMLAQKGIHVGGEPALLAEAPALKTKLVTINAKEHISIGEAAVLLNCSEGHIRNLIRKARKHQTKRPIPFIDLDGVTVFNRLNLLSWADVPKTAGQDLSQ